MLMYLGEESQSAVTCFSIVKVAGKGKVIVKCLKKKGKDQEIDYICECGQQQQ